MGGQKNGRLGLHGVCLGIGRMACGGGFDKSKSLTVSSIPIISFSRRNSVASRDLSSHHATARATITRHEHDVADGKFHGVGVGGRETGIKHHLVFSAAKFQSLLYLSLACRSPAMFRKVGDFWTALRADCNSCHLISAICAAAWASRWPPNLLHAYQIAGPLSSMTVNRLRRLYLIRFIVASGKSAGHANSCRPVLLIRF